MSNELSKEERAELEQFRAKQAAQLKLERHKTSLAAGLPDIGFKWSIFITGWESGSDQHRERAWIETKTPYQYDAPKPDLSTVWAAYAELPPVPAFYCQGTFSQMVAGPLLDLLPVETREKEFYRNIEQISPFWIHYEHGQALFRWFTELNGEIVRITIPVDAYRAGLGHVYANKIDYLGGFRYERQQFHNTDKMPERYRCIVWGRGSDQYAGDITVYWVDPDMLLSDLITEDS